MSEPARPPTATAAQARVVEEVLAWGRPRPIAPSGLVPALARRLDAAFAGGTGPAAGPPTRGMLAVRGLVGSGTWSLEAPFVHDRATVRGILLGRSFARDVEQRHGASVGDLVAAVADELAGERPADPASASAWWNTAPAARRRELMAEIADVLADVRTLWPPLPREHLDVTVRPQVRVPIGAGAVLLAARPDLVLDSPRHDDRARALVVVTRTGMPRPVQDRALVRATALVQTLATGRPPFRWVVLHLTDGRLETEDLDAQVLLATAERIGTLAARSVAAPSTGA